MKCSSARTFFDRMYREGERFGRSDVEAHVRQCEHCSRDYKTWCGIARKLEGAAMPDPPAALYTNVMRAIDNRTANRINRRLAPPQWVPAFGIGFAALLLTAGVSLFIAKQRPIGPSTSLATSMIESLPATDAVHFEIQLADAREVALVGDFNGWSRETHLLARTADGTWKIDLPLQSGCYQYQFLIDGKQWQPDPRRPQLVPDGFGGFNTVIEI